MVVAPGCHFLLDPCQRNTSTAMLASVASLRQAAASPRAEALAAIDAKRRRDRQRAEENFPDNLAWCPVAQAVQRIKDLRASLGAEFEVLSDLRLRIDNGNGAVENVELMQLLVDEQASLRRYNALRRQMQEAEADFLRNIPLVDLNENDDNSDGIRDNNNTLMPMPYPHPVINQHQHHHQ